MNDYTKLSALVNDTFTVEKVPSYTYKAWDNTEKKMLTSDTPPKRLQKSLASRNGQRTTRLRTRADG